MYVQEGKVIDYLNSSGAAIAYGAVVPLVNCIGIAAETIAAGETGSLQLEGVYEFDAINSAAFAVGDWLFWDGSALKLTKLSTDNTPAGICVAVKAQTGTTAAVKLIPSR